MKTKKKAIESKPIYPNERLKSSLFRIWSMANDSLALGCAFSGFQSVVPRPLLVQLTPSVYIIVKREDITQPNTVVNVRWKLFTT